MKVPFISRLCSRGQRHAGAAGAMQNARLYASQAAQVRNVSSQHNVFSLLIFTLSDVFAVRLNAGRFYDLESLFIVLVQPYTVTG